MLRDNRNNSIERPLIEGRWHNFVLLCFVFLAGQLPWDSTQEKERLAPPSDITPPALGQHRDEAESGTLRLAVR